MSEQILKCWECGKVGDFAGQVCDKCFNKMEEDLEARMIANEEEDNKC